MGKAVTASGYSTSHIFVYDFKNPPVDITPSSHRVSYPSWSPDGSQIVSICIDEKRGAPASYNVCVVNSNGGKLTYFYLPSNVSNLSTARWSPDGEKIIFHAEITNEGSVNDGFCWQNCRLPEALFLMNKDGRKLTRIDVGSHEVIWWFAWYP
jgi:Tol biopolymer transport system component